MPTSQQTIDWLMEGDPSIRWQTMADLTAQPPEEVAAERALVAEIGWGARLLSVQGENGRWADALYSPKWTSTTYTLLLLQRLGLSPGHPKALRGCEQLWSGAHGYDGGLNLAKTIREPETCITAMMVFLAASFGLEPTGLDTVVDWLLGQQLDDGGWNCETVRQGSRHGSVHTSISVLEALSAHAAFEQKAGFDQPVRDGLEFLLAHRLFRSHRTGAVIDPALLRFPFPPQWHFDIMRGLEMFRAVGAPKDERLSDAVAVIRKTQRPDGTWPHYRTYPGRYWFPMETRGPGRWSTLRALRILRWYNEPFG